MDWHAACLRLLNRPKVLHRLPGRLRIHLPLLEKVPRQRQDLADLIASLIEVPDEITKAEPCIVTGNALIEYDAGKATEDDVLGLLRGLFEIYLRHRERFEALLPETVPEVIERLKPLVHKAVRHRLAVDVEMEIPDDVLA